MVKSNDIISNIAKDNSKSSEILLDIFELNPDAIALTRVSDGKIIDCNQAYLNQIGYSRDEVIGHTSIELNLLSPKERQAFVNNIQRKKTLTDYEINVKKKDGSFIYVLYSARFITIDGEEIILSIGHEITKRKKLKEENQSFLKEVQDERDKLSALINSIPDEIWFADKDKKFSLANPSALNEFGLFSSDVDVEEMASNLEVYRPDGSPRPVDEAPPLRALNGEIIRNLEEIILIPSRNELRYRQVNASPVKDRDDNIIGSVSVVRDITESKKTEENLKKSEERLLLAQTLGNVGIWDWNTITNELHFTPELEQLYGLTPGTIKTYQDWRQLTHPDDIEKIKAERDEKIANHEQFDLEFRIQHKSGQKHWLSAKGGAIYNDKGDILRVLGVNEDITERINREKELEITMDELKRSNEELERFAYVSSHDFKNL